MLQSLLIAYDLGLAYFLKINITNYACT
uniref:Uncharacterized protein n=1 Tax=Rhizophora mucronata TaxID=61149 RepID=A0A2P2PA20_RHIMU